MKIGNGSHEIDNGIFVRQSLENLSNEYIYSELFGRYPTYNCSYEIHFKNDDEEEEQLTYKKLYDEFSAAGFETISYEFESNQKNPHDINRFYLVSYDDCVSVSFMYGGFCVYTHLGFDVIDRIVNEYLKKYNSDNDEAKCYMIVKDSADMYLKDFPVKIKGDLDFGLYNDGFDEVHKSIVESIKTDQNGLYLLYGKPGTGKTTYIRHLIKECETDKRKFVYVPSNLFGDFTNPNLVPFLMDHRGCIFIIEDCESLVTVENGIRSAELTDLLNMTDGLLADALDIKIICTFNIDDGKIDEALLRPGRCRCRYEFDLLDKDKANAVAERFGLEKTDSDISLADLFNPGEMYKDTNEKKKIGFR